MHRETGPDGGDLESEIAASRELISGLLSENAELSTTVAQLQGALDSRVLIEQAKGVIMGRLDVTDDLAFEILRTAARDERETIRVVAAAIVAARRTPAEIGASVRRERSAESATE